MADNYQIELTLDEIFGTGISSIEQTTVSTMPGGENIWTVTLTNGNAYNFTVFNGTAGGDPIPVLTASAMTDTAAVYLYLGSETGYTFGHWYYYDATWKDGGAYGAKGDKGEDGEDGADGFSPIATVTKSGTTTTISITDENGTTTAQVEDGVRPVVNAASTAGDMTDTDIIYVYVGETTASLTNGDWYFYDGEEWQDGGVYQSSVPVIDATLSNTGQAADAKKVGDEIDDLKSQIETSGGLTSAIKSALLQLAEKVAYKDDDGQTYYDDLYDALYPPVVYTAITLNTNSLSFGTLNTTQQLTATTTPSGGAVTWTSSDTSVATVSQTGVVTSVGYGNATITAMCGSLSATCSVAITQATLSSISAVYTQSGTVYDTDSLDSLKSDLVVTATWSNSTTSTVSDNDYTLSGTLTEGTSTITVNYGGKTDTFTVTVTERGALYPLENGTWDSETTNPVYRITVSNGNHVKFEVLRSVSQQSFANLHDGGLSNSATIINNLSELFVIPTNAEATFTISNVVNSNSVSFNCNFRKANASTSGSFGIGDGAHLSGEIVTKTLSADESVSCAFFYHVQANAPVGSVIEFDMSFTVNGVKYI